VLSRRAPTRLAALATLPQFWGRAGTAIRTYRVDGEVGRVESTTYRVEDEAGRITFDMARA